MKTGRTFYLSLIFGLLTLALLLVGINLPTQLEFESRPYARTVLLSGNLRNRTAEELGLNPRQLELVKAHYGEFMRRNGYEDSSSESSMFENEYEERRYKTPGNATILERVGNDDSSSESSEYEDESSEDLEEGGVGFEQRLQSKPVVQTVALGLFHGRVCKTMKGEREMQCFSISTTEGLFLMNREVYFMASDINLEMWNNLRVESLFSAFACIIGLVCLFTSLRPCCDSQTLPVYVGALAFFASGVLVFVPIVRLLLVRSDFEQNLKRDFNVTTRLLTSWSLLASGLAVPFALVAGFALIATKWVKATKHWYSMLKSKVEGGESGGRPTKLQMSNLHKREATDEEERSNGTTQTAYGESKPFIE